MKNWFVVTRTDVAGKYANMPRINWGMTVFAYLVILAFTSIIVWSSVTPDTQPPLTPEQQQAQWEDYYDYKHGPRG